MFDADGFCLRCCAKVDGKAMATIGSMFGAVTSEMLKVDRQGSGTLLAPDIVKVFAEFPTRELCLLTPGRRFLHGVCLAAGTRRQAAVDEHNLRLQALSAVKPRPSSESEVFGFQRGQVQELVVGWRFRQLGSFLRARPTPLVNSIGL